MALQKFPVEIPLGGAVNEGDVPVVVQPPRILEAENCHSIKGGAYQKRDDDVAVSSPPGEPPFAIGTTDESAITFARLEAQAWTGQEWEQKPACATIAGEARSFYPTDGGELNSSPDLAVTPPQASANEERICAAWYTEDPTLQNKTAYRIFGGPDRRPVIPERRVLGGGAFPPLVQGAVWVRSLETTPGVFEFVIVTAANTAGVLYRLDADGNLISGLSIAAGEVIVDVQAADNFVYVLTHSLVAGGPPPQTTDYELFRVEVTTGVVTSILTGTYPATTSTPCGLYLLGTGATIIFSDGVTRTVPLAGGLSTTAVIVIPCVDTIGTNYPIAAPPPGSYIPPGQIRPRSFLSYDPAEGRAWVGINTQAYQQIPLFPGNTEGVGEPPSPDQPEGRPLGDTVPGQGYNFPSWSNGLYGCAYVEHVFCEVNADGSLLPIANSHGILQGAAVAGNGYYSEQTGHTALLSTPSPANLFSDENVRRVVGPPATAASDPALREDWVQPTVMWCARDVVPAYDAVTPIPVAAPADFRARNQALSIGCFLPNSGTLAEVRNFADELTGMQNTPYGTKPSIAATAAGAVMMTLEWEATQGPEVAQPVPISELAPGTDLVRSVSSNLNGQLLATRPRIFDFVDQTSVDLRSEGVSVATAGPQPITIGRANPLAAGNPLQAPIITYGCPAQDVESAILNPALSSFGGVPVTSGELEPVQLENIIFEGADWPTDPEWSLFCTAVTLRTSLAAIDSDNKEHRSTPWIPNPIAPVPWWGQLLYSDTPVSPGPIRPDFSRPTSVSVVISPVAWQLMGVPATARYELQLYACGPLGQPSQCAVSSLPLVIDWTGQQAGAWTLGEVSYQILPQRESLPYLVGDASLLYTESGELAADAPPPLRAITAANGRLFGIASTRLREIYYTKQSRSGYAPEWNRNLSIRVNDAPDDLTALGALPDGRLLIFTENSTYYTYGQGPSDTGQGSGFAEPALLSRDVGCLDWRTIAEGSFGVMFRGERGIYLIDRQLSLQFVGLPYEDTTTRDIEITSTAVDAFRSEVNFFVRDSGSEQQCWTYNYLRGQWSSYSAPRIIQSATEQGSNVALLTEGTPAVYATREREPSGGESLMILRTGWLAMGRIQGFGRVWEMQIEGRQEVGATPSASGLRVEVYYDYEETASETFDYDDPSDAQGRIKIRLRPARQKCESISVRFLEYDPGVPGGLVRGWELEMLTLLCGVKVGLDKVATTERST